MYKRVFLLSPAGGNGNYIGLVLLGKVEQPALSYHFQGNFSKNNPGVIQYHIWDDSNLKFCNQPDIIAIQNVVKEKFYFVIVNWWEKIFFHQSSDWETAYSDDWLKEQTELWKNFDYPIVRANLNWFYAYKNKNRPELYDVPLIKNKFYFDSLYTNYESAKDQFLKFGIEYTESQYNDWKNSQKCVFDSFQEIQNKPINQLTKDYQKAIAIGLLGIENNLSEEECWQKYKSELN